MKKILTVIVLVLGLMSRAHGLDVPRFQGYINDYAGMISPETNTAIEKDLRDLEQTDSTQIFILTVPSLEGEVLEEFATKVFDTWKAGQKDLDNGVILLVAQKERKIRIEVGRGLEEKLTDLAAGRIIDLVIKPKFKAGDYDGGFVAGVSSLIQATKGEFKAADQEPPKKIKIPFCAELAPIVVRDTGKGPFFFIASFSVIIVLSILKGLKVIKSRKVSVKTGAVALPVIAAFTVCYPGTNFAVGTSLIALFFYVIAGGLLGLASFHTSGIAGRSAGSSGGGGWESSGGDSGGGDSGGDGGGGGDSAGGGGDSGGGGASGDY